jgi:hypothetical protein
VVELATTWKEDCWQQVGVQKENWSWRHSWKVQSKIGGTRLYTEIWTGLWWNFLPSGDIQESLCVLIALSVKSGLKLYQVKVTTAFLNGTLEGEILWSSLRVSKFKERSTLSVGSRRASTDLNNLHVDWM